ncbi:hypothetical protein ACHQM5_020402 [Ranunculus cassubicifolius]
MGIEAHLDPQKWLSELTYGQWAALPVSGSRPPARYKHAAAVADGKLYIVGGSRNGRHLSDIQVFHLRTLTWSALKLNHESKVDSTSVEVLPATSGHSLVSFGNKLYLLGGYSKESSEFVTVRSIDLGTLECKVLKTSGKIPISRAGQSVSLVSSSLIMFGGEYAGRQLLNDIHILDLETMVWDVIETTHTPPMPRFDHTAAVHADRYLLIFGGCSHSTCFNDLHILDLQTKEWSQPETQGDVVAPRADHAAVTIDGNWYIVGGGDNKSGASETLVLNMSKLVWSVLTNVKDRDPLASEGLSLCCASLDGEKLLIAFGGYCGKYNNEVFVLKPKPVDTTRPKIFQSHAAAAAAASVTAAYSLNSKGEQKLDLNKLDAPKDLTIDINAMKAENKNLESSLAEIRAENIRSKEDVSEMKNTYDDLSRELVSVRGQLKAEISRCYKLEVQITSLQTSLESLQTIEEEIKSLRKERFAFEHEMEVGADGSLKRKNSGVWQWIAGGKNSNSS